MGKQSVHLVVVMMNKIVKNSIYLILLSVLISGCCALKSPTKRYDCQLQRAEEKIIVLTRKFPELKLLSDTVTLLDTLRLPELKVDTTFVFNEKIKFDTIQVVKEKLKIQYVRKDSIVYLSGECEGDTIYIEKEVPVERIVVKESPSIIPSKYKSYWWVVLIIIFMTLILRKTIMNLFK